MSQDITEALQPEDYTPEASEHWKVDGIRSADWAVRKLAQFQQARAERQTYVEQVQAWAAAEDEKEAQTVAYFEAVLREWHQEQLAINPKAKTISLPSGKLVARKNPQSLAVVEEGAFLSWAEANRPEWIRVKKSAAVSDMKKALTTEDGLQPVDPETGEYVPGVAVEPGEVKFEVKIEKDEQ